MGHRRNLPARCGVALTHSNAATDLTHGGRAILRFRNPHRRAALDLRAAQGDRHREAALHNNLADLMHAAGQHEDAMRHLKLAVAIFAEVGLEGEPRPEVWKLVRW